MSIKNWLITCEMLSPLCGEPPKIDSLLEYELAMRLGLKHSRKLTRNTKLAEIERPGIPISRRTIDGCDFYCSSDPIIGNVLAEYTDNQSKRFDTDLCAQLLHSKSRKKLLVSSGPYKARFVKKRVRLIDKIYWFVRGDKKNIKKLLKNIKYLGHNRSYGYGQIYQWKFDEQQYDYSMVAEIDNNKILMKTLPIGWISKENIIGYRHSYSGAFPPYWHPETFMEVGIPC